MSQDNPNYNSSVTYNAAPTDDHTSTLVNSTENLHGTEPGTHELNHTQIRQFVEENGAFH